MGRHVSTKGRSEARAVHTKCFSVTLSLPHSRLQGTKGAGPCIFDGSNAGQMVVSASCDDAVVPQSAGLVVLDPAFPFARATLKRPQMRGRGACTALSRLNFPFSSSAAAAPTSAQLMLTPHSSQYGSSRPQSINSP
ncbi:hypothetical protein CGCF413_v000930 [Colletotrichum fructicola]|nr:hypothetical protein CGCF413_v000930 [Colletotrichum fructicola]